MFVFTKKEGAKAKDGNNNETSGESKKDKSASSKKKAASAKGKNKKGDMDEEEGSAEEENERSSQADTERESDDDGIRDGYLDVPDKQQKRDYSANERSKLSKLDSERPTRRIKTVIREKMLQEKLIKVSKKADETIQTTKDNKDKTKKKTIKDLNEEEIGHTESLFKASDVYIELEGIEIESEIEDYDEYKRDRRPAELVVELAEGAQPGTQKKRSKQSVEKTPKEKTPRIRIPKERTPRVRVPKERIPKVRVPKEKVIKEKQPRGPRKGPYTLEEDLELIKYVQSQSGSTTKPTSRKFWEDALKNDNVLGGDSRSSDSCRERYRLFLADLNEFDNNDIENWVSIHGTEGFLLFKKKELEGNEGIGPAHHRLDTIVLKYRAPTAKSPDHKEKKEREKQEKREQKLRDKEGRRERRTVKPRARKQGPEASEERTKTRIEREFEDSNLASENERKETKQTDTPKRADASRRANQASSDQKAQNKKGVFSEDIEEEDEESGQASGRKVIEKYTKNTPKTQKQKQKKRSDMDIEDDIENEEGEAEQIKGSKSRKQLKKDDDDDELNSAKINQIGKQSETVNVQMNQRDMQKVAEKADLIKTLSRSYNKTPQEFLQIFYYCSMNMKILEDYFNGDESAIWSKEEDDVLLQGREPAVRVLEKYKSVESVQIRQEFLSNFKHMEMSLY